MSDQSVIKTKYGTFTSQSKPRLDLTYDYEDSAITAFANAAQLLGMSCCIDVGANIGCYSVYLSKVASINKIFAFEPAPVAFAELNKNIALQDDSEKFHSFNIALSDSTCQVDFLIVSDMSGANRIDGGSVRGKHIEVPCEALDAIVDCKDQKIALKIDVEGHELRTIAGMTELLKNNRCLVQIECLEEKHAARMKKIMRSHRYTLSFILRDDYIFLSDFFLEAKDDIQQIYFKALQDDLRDLLSLRIDKRRLSHSASAQTGEKPFRDPILL